MGTLSHVIDIIYAIKSSATSAVKMMYYPRTRYVHGIDSQTNVFSISLPEPPWQSKPPGQFCRPPTAAIVLPFADNGTSETYPFV